MVLRLNVTQRINGPDRKKLLLILSFDYADISRAFECSDNDLGIYGSTVLRALCHQCDKLESVRGSLAQYGSLFKSIYLGI